MNWPEEKKIEVPRAEAAQHPRREIGRILGQRESEDIEAVEAIANRASEGGMLAARSEEMLIVAHEEPGVGPNKYNFDDNVRYEIHVATGPDLAAGRASYTYQFDFATTSLGLFTSVAHFRT